EVTAAAALPAEPAPTHLSDSQQRALERIESLLAGGGGNVLLAGATGSGKTEGYSRACEAALAAGRGAIVLVPEIALTPQTLGRFRARFGERVALLHSGLSEAERRDERERTVTDEASVVVGARSAVLAPLPSVGVICVDQEHDSSYNQEPDPRYDARTVAAERRQGDPPPEPARRRAGAPLPGLRRHPALSELRRRFHPAQRRVAALPWLRRAGVRGGDLPRLRLGRACADRSRDAAARARARTARAGARADPARRRCRRE